MTTYKTVDRGAIELDLNQDVLIILLQRDYPSSEGCSTH